MANFIYFRQKQSRDEIADLVSGTVVSLVSGFVVSVG
jgi:hypothetical protein